MLRIAVQNPVFLFRDQERSYTGYDFVFFRKYASIAYRCTAPVDCAEKEAVLSGKKTLFCAEDLEREADVLVCFNGEPYLFGNEPERNFHGLKVYHTMDFVFRAEHSSQLYRSAGVDYLMGYCRHDIHSGFFRKYFADYSGKIIPVPFGYGKRFLAAGCIPFKDRKNKAVALGSVNPVDDPLCPPGVLDEYKAYYRTEEFTHKLRREIVRNRDKWKKEIDAELLPSYPDTKNIAYDPVAVMGNYTMFINDAGIMNFPPARTYEGIAAGCVMVAEDMPIWEELGFRDGYNAVLFQAGDYGQMIKKIQYYMQNEEQLEKIQKSARMLLQRYSHECIADTLFKEICRKTKAQENNK